MYVYQGVYVHAWDFMSISVCVCVCVCVRERERERESIYVYQRTDFFPSIWFTLSSTALFLLLASSSALLGLSTRTWFSDLASPSPSPSNVSETFTILKRESWYALWINEGGSYLTMRRQINTCRQPMCRQLWLWFF